MTKEDILQAFKLTAMGRYGHDLHVQLAEALAQAMAQSAAALERLSEEVEPEPAKRGRKPKAD